MTVIDKKAVGKRIKRIRTEKFEKKMTLEDFGNLISPPAGRALVSHWERGINLPNTDRLKQIALLGNVSTDYLLFGKEKNGYGDKIKSIRDNIKIPKEVFASRLGVSIETIDDFEEENSLPTKIQLEEIAKIGNTTVDEIVWDIPNDISLPIKEQFESTQSLIKKYLNDTEQVSSENFFSMMDTLLQLQLGDENDKRIFSEISKIVASLIYLSNTGPDSIYPSDYSKLDKKLNESLENINNASLNIKEISLEKRTKF